MLKLVFFTLLISGSVRSWFGVQLRIFLGAFLLSLCGLREFYLGGVRSIFGVDFVGYILILLSFWIIGLVCCARHKIYESNNFFVGFLLVCVLLMLSLVLTFSSMDYLTFYVFFERSLIPTIILILGWGYQPERLQAGVYILFYTLFASLPLLVSLIVIYNKGGTLAIGLVGVVSGSSFLDYV